MRPEVRPGRRRASQVVNARCPRCLKWHVDEGEFAERPHSVHLCVDDAAGAGCGAEWRGLWPAVCAMPALNYSGRMFAELVDGVYFHQSPSTDLVEMRGVPARSVVEVDLAEDPDGAYYGWIAAGDEEPSLVWPSEEQRDMCFPYGSAVAEEHGEGRRVRLSCRPRTGAGAEAPGKLGGR